MERTGRKRSTRSSASETDSHDLNRFVQAQEDDYEQALSEIAASRKRTHWMWYIFPQLDGLAFNSTSKRSRSLDRSPSPRLAVQ